MNIKRLISFITIIAFSLGLLSCSSVRSMVNERLSELNCSNDNEVADKCFENIIDDLGNKDKEGLKKMFSTKALKDANDIDGGIDYLMDFYKGEIQSKDRAVVTNDSKSNGEKKTELDCMYTVVTDKDTYIVFFIDQAVDKKNPDNLGLYMLQIIKASDEDNEFDWGQGKTKCAGIYRPDTTKQ